MTFKTGWIVHVISKTTDTFKLQEIKSSILSDLILHTYINLYNLINDHTISPCLETDIFLGKQKATVKAGLFQ